MRPAFNDNDGNPITVTCAGCDRFGRRLHRECQWQGVRSFANLTDRPPKMEHRGGHRKGQTELVPHIQSPFCRGSEVPDVRSASASAMKIDFAI